MVALITRIHSDDFLQFPLDIIPEGSRLGVLLSAFALVIIPLILLFILGLRIIFKKIQLTRPVIQSLVGIWLVALGFGVYYATEISASYRHHATATQEISLNQNPNHVFRLKLDEDYFTDSLHKRGFLSNDPNIIQRRKRFGLHFGGDYEENGLHQVNFRIEKSSSNSAYMEERFTALGPNYEAAIKTATDIIFPFVQKDSLLTVGRRFSYPAGKPYRGQDASITLFLPMGTTIWIDKDTKDMVDWNWDTSLDDYDFKGKPEDVYIMTQDGLKPKYGVLKPKEEDGDKPEKPEQKEMPEKSDSL
jgi:hypothetical protein